MSAKELSEYSMAELFAIEAENQTATLTRGLLELEKRPGAADLIEACMRAAHSIKGAARIVNLGSAVAVAHVMEDGFVAAQRGKARLGKSQIDLLLGGVDLLSRISRTPHSEAGIWQGENKAEIDRFLSNLAASLLAAKPEPSSSEAVQPPLAPAVEETGERVLRVTADHLSRLVGLAGETLVESGRLKPMLESLLRLRRTHDGLGKAIIGLLEAIPHTSLQKELEERMATVHDLATESRRALSEKLMELDSFNQRLVGLSQNLYQEARACRMRPFADGIQGFPRMVRDLAHSLGKEINLQITGDAVPVDRDILQRLEAPLNHLLRNAVDHAIEPPEERMKAGKPRAGLLQLQARHSAGMLSIVISDDGRGIDLEHLRATVLQKKMDTAETAAKLNDAELLEFLFLPGFSMKDSVTEISGRGVGLDVVRNMVRKVRGNIRASSRLGQGMTFQMQLPLTLSVVRTLVAEIGGEAYAFPLASIVRALRLPGDAIETLESRPHFQFEGRQIGLVAARQVLDRDATTPLGAELPVIVVADEKSAYGLLVDRFLGERELVVQPFDTRLGKVKDMSAGAFLEDGAPVLIVDIEDMLRSVEKLVSTGGLANVKSEVPGQTGRKSKRILVVDDSLTVRELERKLLSGSGYEVEVAVDGMDGWNAARGGHFDLVVTDVDMPRMDGIELVTLIKRDSNLKSLPVMIVSYQDRDEDRRRGLDAGADYYLSKGSFHDEALLQAVTDLIGDSGA